MSLFATIAEVRKSVHLKHIHYVTIIYMIISLILMKVKFLCVYFDDLQSRLFKLELPDLEQLYFRCSRCAPWSHFFHILIRNLII